MLPIGGPPALPVEDMSMLTIWRSCGRCQAGSGGMLVFFLLFGCVDCMTCMHAQGAGDIDMARRWVRPAYRDVWGNAAV